MRYLLVLFMAFTSQSLLSQEDSIPPQPTTSDSLRVRQKQAVNRPATGLEMESVTIKDYKLISHARDTIYLDTALTIQKEYNYNYLRRDDFELMPFANVGQPYNALGISFDNASFYPRIGARAKHFNYLEVEDMTYYNVATPLTDLFFKTTFEQGQLLDAILTFNLSRRFNISIAYKGFRSLGKYQFSQAESGNFRTTANYVTPDSRYGIRAHIAAQEIEAEENGGLAEPELQFDSEDPEFQDRSRLDVVFNDARNKILGKRYYMDHYYELLKGRRDSVASRNTLLTMGHTFSYETKFYQFTQEVPRTYFGPAFLSPIDDKAHLKAFNNEWSASFYNKILGTLKGYSRLYSYTYYFNSILVTDSGQIPNRLKGEEVSVGASYLRRIGDFSLMGNGAYTVSGELSGNLLDASASYTINDKHTLTAALHSSARMPNFNFLLYQSDYENYNWDNTASFSDQKAHSLKFDLESQVWGNLSAGYSSIDNYTYFTSDATPDQIDTGEENAFIKPKQESNSVGYLKLRFSKEFRIGHWALNNTVMYQTVSQSNPVLNLPELVTRNTLYYSNDVFKKAMFLQTGVTFKYFTAYYMDAYNPLLGEFYVQGRQKLGGFPMLDFFINARVRQTRIYLKAEHFNSSFSGNTFYAAPGYPYRDFVIRFGLVWNFFS